MQSKTAKGFFEKELPDLLAADPAKFKDTPGKSIHIKVSGPAGGEWVLDWSSVTGILQCKSGSPATASATIELSDANFAEVLKQPSSATGMYLTGKIKIWGDLMFALKFVKLLS